jgi:pyrroline-5-carboxylate reductase
MRIGFIGAGKMAQALIDGLLRADVVSADRLYAADPSEERRALFADALGANVLSDNVALVAACDVVVLAVKPYIIPAVAEQVTLPPGRLLVSIAAGVTLDALAGMFGTRRTVRVMPNTPALVGCGASAWCTGPDATDADAELIQRMLGAVGLCVRVEEAEMDAVTGLSGSGPAYIYSVIEALADGGVREGLPAETAARLAAQTVLGAAQMVLSTGRAPSALRSDVATPGGTTVEGLAALDAGNLAQTMQNAVAAAAQRSREMKAEK